MKFWCSQQITNGSLSEKPAVALIYPASQDLIAGVPANACYRQELPSAGEYVMPPGTRLDGRSARLGTSDVFDRRGIPKARAGSDAAKHSAGFRGVVQICPGRFYTHRPSDGPRNLNLLSPQATTATRFRSMDPERLWPIRFIRQTSILNRSPGDLHFDNAENWQSGVNPDFYAVVLHELGHALGLGHTNNPNAVMYPYYRKFDGLQVAGHRGDSTAVCDSRGDGYGAGSSAPSIPSTPPSAPGNVQDKSAPTLRITSPATTIISTSASTMRISGSASDKVGVSKVIWTANGGRSGVANGLTSWVISDLELRVGDNQIVIRAYDEAGNSSWRSLTITRR